jgi:hypothetical protein
MFRTSRRVVVCLAAVLTGLLAAPAAVLAQAWVPEKGDVTVSLAVQELNVKKHFSGTQSIDAGHINTVVFLTDATYGLTNKLAVDLAVPFVSTAYAGARPHPGTDIDNGEIHSSFTDLRFSVRYNLKRDGVVITPYAGSITPSHDYAYYGHAAFGEQLRELQVGAFVAKLFKSGVPGLFVSGRAAYGFVEKVQDISHNRSMGDLEVGYFFTPSFRAFGMTSGQFTHGGIDFPINGQAGLPLALRPVHDVIQKVHYLNAGGGFAYSLNDSVDLFGSFTRQVAGRNGHVLNRGITFGASWSISRRPKADATVTAREGSLGRCICQRSGT